MAQQASPNVMGHSEDLRAQFTTLSTVVKTRFSPNLFWTMPVISVNWRPRSGRDVGDRPARSESTRPRQESLRSENASELAVLRAHPLQVALAPDVGQGDGQDGDEDEAFRERQRPQLAVDDRPRQQEHRLHVEDDEEQREHVEADVELDPGRTGRVLAALVGGELLLA